MTLTSFVRHVSIAALIGASTTASASDILVKVSLYPVGSFEIKSSAVKGKDIKKEADGYTASELTVPVKSLKTGIELRDEHMQERLNPKGKHPNIIVKNIKAADGKGTADIKVAGITKKIDFKYKDKGGKAAVATFELLLPDFKIDDVSYKGVGVEDELEVVATIDYEGK